jgi:hypothetical protein
MENFDYRNFGEKVYEKRFLPINLGLSSRLVSYWRKMEMLPFLNKDKKAFMDITQALWLLIVNELMLVGISTKKIKSLSERVWIEPFRDKYADKVLEENLKNPGTRLTDIERQKIQACLDDEVVMNAILRREINPYTDKVKKILKEKRAVSSFIYNPKTEEFIFHNFGKNLLMDLNNFYNSGTIISIPIFPLLSKLVAIEIDKSKGDLIYLSNIENQIRRTLIYDKPKLMEIDVTGKEKKIWKITEQHKKAEELANFFLSNKLPLKSQILIEPRSQGNFKITIKS